VTAFSLRATKTDGRGDIAYVQGTFAMTVAAKGGAAPEQASGYFLQVLRRQPNGTWQIAVQMLSLH
jgi:ketosteroid isomerase-like protein